MIVDEAILDVVELVDVVHNFLTLFLYQVLNKSVSANATLEAACCRSACFFTFSLSLWAALSFA
jgi:hypothetical protein